MRPQYSITTDPYIEPVSLDEITAHVRVDSSDDYEYLTGLIPVAREMIEGQTCRASSKATWTLTAESWDSLFRDYPAANAPMPSITDPIYGVTNTGTSYAIPIFRYPLVSVSSVKYYAPSASVLTTMSASDYRVTTAAEPGIIQLVAAPPAVHDRVDAIQITFVAGSDAPSAATKHSIKMLVAHLYENRLPVNMGNIVTDIPFTLNALIAHQKSSGFF